jgi:UDP-N-acetylmuramoyl-tripeptide--D-alanyl-D-alanine ligase
MGAYKRGEIKNVCEITPPDVSIITTIADQHLALFKTIENTLKAKYEIVENSKKEAVVILNGDNDLCLRVAGKSKKREILFSLNKELDIWASDIKADRAFLEFNVHYKDEVQRFEVKMLGDHNVANILAATAAALVLGMTLKQVADVLKKTTQKLGRLSVRESKYGWKILDDSYNSNAAGFEAALEYLKNMKGRKKILVTIGVLELGEDKEAVYKKLGNKINTICDVLLTTDNRLKDAVDMKKVEVLYETGVERQLQYLRNDIGKEDVVLFEGPNLRLLKEVTH